MTDRIAALPEAPAASARIGGQLSWVAYDMAGGPYFNVVKVFVFAPYFASEIVGNSIKGQALWGYVEGTAGLLIALLSALVGSATDAYGARKPLMAALSAIVVAGLLLIWGAAPNSAVLPLAALLVMIAVAAELSFLCHGSLLSIVAPESRVGLLSGLGYSFSYLGTLIVFIAWLWLFGLAAIPALGLDRAHAEDIRIIGPMCALWFSLCAVPFFLFTPDGKRNGPGFIASIGLGLTRLKATLGHARHYANIVRYFLARMVYFDGLVATFTFIGIYASGVFGWRSAQVGLYGLVIFSVIVFAAIIGGLIDDRIGSRRTILIGLCAVMTSVFLGLSVGPHSIFYIVQLSPAAIHAAVPIVGAALSRIGFTTLPEQVFVLCGVLGGIFMGPTLASSRTLLARIAPQSMMAEFFGIFTLSGKATSFLAPLAIAVATSLTGSQRIGIATVLVFLLAGFFGLLTVKEERSAALA